MYENLTFFPRQAIAKFFLFYTLSTQGKLHTEFGLVWTTLWPNKKHFWSGDSLSRGHLTRTIFGTMLFVWCGPWWSHNLLENSLEVVGRWLENGLNSGIFHLGIFWSEVIWRAQSSGKLSGFRPDHDCTVVWQWPDLGLIRGHFRMGMVWSETVFSAHLAHTLFWAHFSLISGYFRLGWSDQRLLPSGTVWSEVTSRWHLNLGVWTTQIVFEDNWWIRLKNCIKLKQKKWNNMQFEIRWQHSITQLADNTNNIIK